MVSKSNWALIACDSTCCVIVVYISLCSYMDSIMNQNSSILTCCSSTAARSASLLSEDVVLAAVENLKTILKLRFKYVVVSFNLKNLMCLNLGRWSLERTTVISDHLAKTGPKPRKRPWSIRQWSVIAWLKLAKKPKKGPDTLQWELWHHDGYLIWNKSSCFSWVLHIKQGLMFLSSFSALDFLSFYHKIRV